MPVSPFYRLSHANCRVSLKRKVLAQQNVTTPRRKILDSVKTAAPRTRGSVRRASGFVQIPITLIDPSREVFPILPAPLQRPAPREEVLSTINNRLSLIGSSVCLERNQHLGANPCIGLGSKSFRRLSNHRSFVGSAASPLHSKPPKRTNSAKQSMKTATSLN